MSAWENPRRFFLIFEGATMNISREEFNTLEPGLRIPIHREIMADLETPVSAYLKVTQGSPQNYLLESVEGGERWARYSFIGVGARGSIVVHGRNVKLEGSFGNEELESDDPLRILYEKTVQPHRKDPVLPDFFGGAVGYSSYDLVRVYEKLPAKNPDEIGIPDLHFIEPEGMVIFDHLKHKLFVVSSAETGNPASFENAIATVERLHSRLRGPLPGVPGDRPSRKSEFKSNFTQPEYEAAVEKALEYVRAGDIFQVQISQRFTAELHTHPFAVYRALRSVNPSPHMGYLELGDCTFVAASPESLCKSDGVTVVTRPIAGTRKRGATPKEDLALEHELQNDPKERAEHIMLVDLGRNDLGRVAKYGSVRVHDLMFIERYSHVMHLVSDVRGELAEGKTPLDALATTLPMGTVTGAPKIRSMEIIEELEQHRRSWYGGAFGYIAHDGSMNMALTLRTALVKDGKIHIQAAGGVVADSNPTFEYEESISKARALRRAVEMAEAGM
jgi:anthranilate synthase component I